jgi:hypothetical protein
LPLSNFQVRDLVSENQTFDALLKWSETHEIVAPPLPLTAPSIDGSELQSATLSRWPGFKNDPHAVCSTSLITTRGPIQVRKRVRGLPTKVVGEAQKSANVSTKSRSLLIPVALVIGILVGCVVPLMSSVAQFAHVLIYGIPLDVRLSASTTVKSRVALVAPVAGGVILGLMEFARRKWKIANRGRSN